MDDNSQVLRITEALMERLTPADHEATLQAITNAAVEVLPQVHYCSITIRHADDKLDTYAVTDELLIDLDAKQFEWREGPCYDGATDTLYSVAPDLLHDSRYPRYGAAAADVGILSQAGLRLFDNKNTIGALNLYSRDLGAFEDVETLNRLFAHQAAIAISYSTEIKNLTQALESRQTIGQAIGMIRGKYDIPEQQAFAFLVRLSSTRNMKLREVAREIVSAVGSEPASE